MSNEPAVASYNLDQSPLAWGSEQCLTHGHGGLFLVGLQYPAHKLVHLPHAFFISQFFSCYCSRLIGLSVCSAICVCQQGPQLTPNKCKMQVYFLSDWWISGGSKPWVGQCFCKNSHKNTILTVPNNNMFYCSLWTPCYCLCCQFDTDRDVMMHSGTPCKLRT